MSLFALTLLGKTWIHLLHPLAMNKIVKKTRFFSLGLTANLGEGNWIQTSFTPLQNWCCLKYFPWGGVEYCIIKRTEYHYIIIYKVLSKSLYIYIYIIIMSCRQHEYPWPSLNTPPYRSSLLVGPQGYIPYPHRAAVCRFELYVLLLLGHMRGSIGKHHLWARPCFSSRFLHVWFVLLW